MTHGANGRALDGRFYLQKSLFPAGRRAPTAGLLVPRRLPLSATCVEGRLKEEFYGHNWASTERGIFGATLFVAKHFSQ
jgi:hypothetical protein